MFEGNYGNLTFAHVIASNCSWNFFIIIYLFGLVLWFFCFLCHSVSNSRQNVEVYMSYWVLLWKLQGYKGNCFQSTRKEILGNTHVTNSNQILLSFTFVSYSLDIMLKLKADFFIPRTRGMKYILCCFYSKCDMTCLLQLPGSGQKSQEGENSARWGEGISTCALGGSAGIWWNPGLIDPRSRSCRLL